MELSSFFNSINHDRVYMAEDWASYFASFIGNGVFPQPSNGLQVIAGSGMAITVRAGKGWINGYYYRNTDDLTLTLATADGALKRIDRIVLRWDLNARNMAIKVKSSQYSALPTAPALQRDADAYELCLADVLINAGVTGIIQANITDQRYNGALCGIVIGVIQQIDPSVLTAQFNSFFELYRQLIIERYASYSDAITSYQVDAGAAYAAFLASLNAFEASAQEDFETWFDSIKGILDGDIAGQLAAEILELQQEVAELQDEIDHITTVSTEAWLSNSYSGSAYLSSSAA